MLIATSPSIHLKSGVSSVPTNPHLQRTKQLDDDISALGTGKSHDETLPEKSSVIGLIGRSALGAGLGVYAGLAKGLLPGIAGSLVLGPTLGLVLGLGGGILAEKLGTTEADTVGVALWAGIAGMALGIAGGAAVGAHTASPAAAIALGSAGALGGFLGGVF